MENESLFTHKISLVKSQTCFNAMMTIQSLFEAEKSLLDLGKCVFLVSKYNNFRTQFETKETRKEERKIIDYQNNFVKIIDAISNVLIYKLGVRELDKNAKQILGNIDKVEIHLIFTLKYLTLSPTENNNQIPINKSKFMVESNEKVNKIIFRIMIIKKFSF